DIFVSIRGAAFFPELPPSPHHHSPRPMICVVQSPERDQLILENMPLVRSELRKLREARADVRQLDANDAESAGYLALIDAAEGYDPSLGFAFSTYAVPAIRRAIIAETSRGVIRHPQRAKHRLACQQIGEYDP